MAVMSPGAATADWFGALEAGAVYDDNLSRSERSADARSDTGLRGLIEGGRTFRLENGGELTFAGTVDYKVFDEFGGMDHWTAGLSGSWRKRVGLGPFAPEWSARAAVERLAFDDTIRNGWRFLGELGWAKRLVERWDIEVAAFYEARRGNRSAAESVFDQSRFGASVFADFTAGKSWLLSVGYAYRNGDIDSNATPDDRIIAAQRARAEDAVFGDGRVVYRLKAHVHALSFDLTRGLTANSSLVFGYQFQSIRARGGIDYDRNQLSLSYVHAF